MKMRLTVGALLIASAGAGCELLTGLGGELPYPADGGAGGSGGGSSTSTGTTVSCSDGVKNGAETDKDCGGDKCSPCADGQGCNVGPDCASSSCVNGTCLQPGCSDKLKNGSETDVDCGGSCLKCPPGKACTKNADCKGNVCENLVCASTCSDSVQGGVETDVDCGGLECPPCADSQKCSANSDCASGNCKLGVCAGTHVWSEHFGGTGSVFSNGVAVDVFGNSTVIGTLTGSADLGGGLLTTAGGNDVVVAKYDPTGGYLWSKRFGGAMNQTPNAVAMDGFGNAVIAGALAGAADFGGGLLTSAGNSDVFVAKFSLAGKPVWSERFGDGQDQVATGVVMDGSGDAIVTGRFYGAVDFGDGKLTSTGGSNVFLAKMSTTGSHLWSQRFGGAKGASANGVATDSSGNVVVTGEFEGTIDFGGGTLTSHGSAFGAGDVFVAKFNSSGQPTWSTSFGDTFADFGTSVATDVAGNVIVAGTFQGSVDLGGAVITSAAAMPDVFVVKLDPAGKYVWSRKIGGATQVSFPSIAVDQAGDVLVTANFVGAISVEGGPLLTSAGDSDVLIVKFDSAGGYVWSKAFGDLAGQYARGIATKGANHVVFTGDFAGSINFGGQQLVASGARDIWLAELLTP